MDEERWLILAAVSPERSCPRGHSDKGPDPLTFARDSKQLRQVCINRNSRSIGPGY